MTTTPTMPPGWYQDPTHRHEFRFWDGATWTPRVSDGGVTADDAPSWTPPFQTQSPPPVVLRPAGPGGRPGGRRHRSWIVAAVVAVVVAGMAVALLVWSPWSGNGPAVPGTVRGQSTTATSIRLTWTPGSGGPTVDSYVVVRDGLDVATVPQPVTSYLDRRLTPATTYKYRVVAVSGTTRSHPSAEVAVATRGPQPAAFRAVRVTSTSAAFRWTRPAAAPMPGQYVIVRNDKDIATLPARLTSYRDTRLVPATTYRYRVVAVWAGHRSTPSAVRVVRTTTPPVAAARLQGAWTVTSKVVRSDGGNVAVGTTMTDSWQFTPRCAIGPCAVRVSALLSGNMFTPHPFTARLSPTGGVYEGSTTAHVTHCGSISVTNTVQVRIRITRAGVDNGIWAARSWVGTVTVAAPYTSAGGLTYCPAQSFTVNSASSR